MYQGLSIVKVLHVLCKMVTDKYIWKETGIHEKRPQQKRHTYWGKSGGPLMYQRLSTVKVLHVLCRMATDVYIWKETATTETQQHSCVATSSCDRMATDVYIRKETATKETQQHSCVATSSCDRMATDVYIRKETATKETQQHSCVATSSCTSCCVSFVAVSFHMYTLRRNATSCVATRVAYLSIVATRLLWSLFIYFRL